MSLHFLSIFKHYEVFLFVVTTNAGTVCYIFSNSYATVTSARCLPESGLPLSDILILLVVFTLLFCFVLFLSKIIKFSKLVVLKICCWIWWNKDEKFGNFVINLRFSSMIWVFRLILICHFVSSSSGKQVHSCLGWLVQIDFLSLGQIDFQSVVVFWGFGGLMDSFFSVNRHYLLQFWCHCYCFVFPPHSAVLHFAVCVVELQFLSLKRKWKSVRYFVA